MSDYPRDLIGYANNPPDPQWPNNARLAVNFVINYEEGISISREFDVEQFREFSLELQREISEERRLMISQELSNFYRNLTIQHRIEIIQQHQVEIQYLS